MNGATADPWLKTIRAPNNTRTNNIGINQTRKTLLNHIKNISIFPLKRGDTDNIVDKILNNI